MLLDRSHIKDVYKRLLFDKPGPVENHDIQLQYILRYIPKQSQSFILDAGCGNGKYALKLSELGYGNIHAVDLFEQIPWIDRFSYVQGSIDKLPYRDNAFDFLYANSVVYYLSEPEKGIGEFRRVLVPGGHVMITAHTKYSLFTLSRMIQMALKLSTAEHLQGVRFYSANEYAGMLIKNGFEIKLIDGYKLSFLFAPLYRKIAFLCNQRFPFRLPIPTASIAKNSRIARLKSEFAYHSVIVATKM
jgi:SAM-dependent methyltransferase